MVMIGTRLEPFMGLASSINSLSKGNARSAARLEVPMARSAANAAIQPERPQELRMRETPTDDDTLGLRMSLSENRFPLFRDMRWGKTARCREMEYPHFARGGCAAQ